MSTSDLPEAATLPDRTIWHIEDNAGGVWQVTVIGANGRISYGRPSASRGEVGGEVRFYRTPTAKHFDAVIPEVRRVWSQNVIVEKVGVTKETEEMMKEREKVDKERFETIIERVISKKDEEAEEAPW